MTTVLIGYATRTSSARDVAHTLAEALRERGHEVRVTDLKDKPAVDDAGFVIVGSGINASAWYGEANAWLAQNATELQNRPLAVFNTCLAAADLNSRDEALGYNAAVVKRTGALSNESFAGRYVPTNVGFFRRLLMRAMKQGEQDHFDPDAVRAWAKTLNP